MGVSDPSGRSDRHLDPTTFRPCRAGSVERIRPLHRADGYNCAMAGVLDYGIYDADNHFNEPLDLYERYIDPGMWDKAIQLVTDPDGNRVQLYEGKPSKFTVTHVVYTDDQLADMLGDRPATLHGGTDATMRDDAVGEMPGLLLNRLNPLRGLDDDARRAVVAQFRDQAESFHT